ncbi:MAG: hypothetical protein PHT02_15065 [Tissierellia bacterium]|nr:hypothetical protein [Tissierellia bacterium]
MQKCRNDFVILKDIEGSQNTRFFRLRLQNDRIVTNIHNNDRRAAVIHSNNIIVTIIHNNDRRAAVIHSNNRIVTIIHNNRIY